MTKINNVIIYTLSDPDTLEIKYIGKTSKSIEKRLQGHIDDAKYRKKLNKRLSWVKSLIKKGKTPIIEQLDIVNEKYANSAEIYWISQFKTWGFTLKNDTEGGDGIFMSKEIREKISVNCKNKKRSQATKDKMSLSKKGKRTGKESHLYGTQITAKKVLQFTKNGVFLKEWNSALEAASKLQINNTNISRVCSGERKSTGGFIWKLKNPKTES